MNMTLRKKKQEEQNQRKKKNVQQNFQKIMTMTNMIINTTEYEWTDGWTNGQID